MTASTEAPLRSVDEAIADVLSAVQAPLEAEMRAPEAALGRFLAAPATARTDLPPWDNSAMDGYALRSGDTAHATAAQPVLLRVSGEVRAGRAPDGSIAPGRAFRIATGAMLPDGADAVVPVELTTAVDEKGGPVPRAARRANGVARAGGVAHAGGPLPDGILVTEAVPAGGSVRRRASDLRADTVVLVSGSLVTPAAVALAAGAGIDGIAVHRRPRVGVLATGDEVRPAGQALGPAGIPDANGPGLRALVAAAGAEPIDLGIAGDRLEDVESRLRRGLDGADVIIVSGGVSVGPYDVVRAAFEAVGRVDLWRVAVQPGKPFAFGVADASAGRRALLFGLPGNPVSTAVTFELFVRPALRKLAGGGDRGPADDRAVLTERVTKGHGRRAYLRVVAERDEDGRVRRDDRGRVPVRLAGGQGSHVLSALAVADALAVVSEDTDSLDAGAEVALHWLVPG